VDSLFSLKLPGTLVSVGVEVNPIESFLFSLNSIEGIVGVSVGDD
jgi:hypothetical protein